MKAQLAIREDSPQAVLTLTPETPDEQGELKVLAAMAARNQMLNCRGIAYMEPGVEFLIQPMPRGD